MSITESGITLNFPNENYFRFQDCPGYRAIQQNFKEMDCCWFDEDSNRLYLIELKDWGDGTLLEENDGVSTAEKIDEMKKRISKYRIQELFKKSLDSTAMIMSIKLNTPYSSKINDCIPFEINNNTEVTLLSIINWSNPDPSYISTVHSQYKTLFKSYAKLYDIKGYAVMTKSQAEERFDWVN